MHLYFQISVAFNAIYVQIQHGRRLRKGKLSCWKSEKMWYFEHYVHRSYIKIEETLPYVVA